MSTTAGRRADAVRNQQLALEATTALLTEPGAVLTVEAIARRAGLGAGTVVRAFGGKDALLDAAVSRLLGPVVDRARDLAAQPGPAPALRTLLAELIAFQSAHHSVTEHLDGLDLPATTAMRAELVGSVRQLIAGGRRDGVIRTDLDPEVTATLISEATFAIARTAPSPELADAFLTVLMDGLRP
ncbi:TetR family transcriptional regulator [Longispora fulva]|uniref:AcrR family transcriptional regulator n=1 Tax=Longispora fulva TaxID=619741 RepID=A0A8J7G660_9ACTN|nr:TetR/AcrR family transcriptional regulator [Longispora fulva]MBG6134403.1 AcrR family transcriptional regulator [Longispora fulva]GIG62680.1 TetR family transcriptional regulator [Longispora fulva]